MGKKPESRPGPSRLARAGLAANLRTFLKLLGEVADDPRNASVDAVHDLRVCSRRTESAMWALRDQFPRPFYRQLRRALKDARSGAGRARDLDVVAGKLECSPKELASFQRRRERSLRSIDARSASRLCRAALKLLRESPPVPARSAADHARALNCEASVAIHRALDRVREVSGAKTLDDLHRLRRRCKRLRLVVEFFLPALPKSRGQRELERIKRVLAALGAMCDAAAIAQEAGRSRPGGDHAKHKRLLREAKGDARRVWQSYLKKGGLDRIGRLAPAA